jgi:hypothetical protein
MYSLIFIFAVHFSNSVYGWIFRGPPQYSELLQGLYHEEQIERVTQICVHLIRLVQAVHTLILTVL